MKVLIFKDIKNKRWTLWNESKTKHLGYVDNVILSDCKMVIYEEKRQRVLKSKKRFPHAFIIGTLNKNLSCSLNKEITYNPFKDKHFKLGNKKVLFRKLVLFREDGKCFSK